MMMTANEASRFVGVGLATYVLYYHQLLPRPRTQKITFRKDLTFRSVVGGRLRRQWDKLE